MKKDKNVDDETVKENIASSKPRLKEKIIEIIKGKIK